MKILPPGARGLKMLTSAGRCVARVEWARLTNQKIDEASYIHKHRWAKSCIEAMGVNLRLSGLQPEHRSPRPRLIISNHRTILDIPILLHLFDAGFLARGDLATWPIIGRGAEIAGCVFVDRESKHSRSGSIGAMRREFEAGRHLVVFPEGTTHPGDVVRPFRGGAFRAATQGKVDVIPVGLAYPHGLEFTEDSVVTHGRKLGRYGATIDVGVAVGEPLTLPRSPRECAAVARNAVQALVTEARQSIIY